MLADQHVPGVCRLHQLRRLRLTSQVGRCLHQVLIQPHADATHSDGFVTAGQAEPASFATMGKAKVFLAATVCQFQFLLLLLARCVPRLARPLSTHVKFM